MYRKKLHTNKALFISSIALLLSVTAGTLLYADNPPSPFTPTQNIQDPLCLPTDANCYVSIAGSQWNDISGGISFEGNIVFTGALLPNDSAGTIGQVLTSQGDDTTPIWTTLINSGIANRLAYYASSGTTLSNLPAITASRALISDANGLPIASSVSTTELGYLSGTTSAIQTQLDGKISNVTGLITSGTNISINGDGTSLDPYVISAAGSTIPDLQAVSDVGAITTNELIMSNIIVTGTGNSFNGPTNLTATQTCAVGCNYYAFGYEREYRIYAYKDIGGGDRIYSSTYAALDTPFVDDGSYTPFDVTLVWDAVAGVDGYRVLVSENYAYGTGYNYGYDTTSTSLIDDYNSFYFDGGMATVAPTGSYGNTSSINGTLQLSGPVGVGIVSPGNMLDIVNNPTLAYGYSGLRLGVNSLMGGALGTTSTVLGVDENGDVGVYSVASSPIIQYGGSLISNGAGSNSSNNIFFGSGAGSGASDTQYSTFFGYNAGNGAINGNGNFYVGWQTGYGAYSSPYTTFVGAAAGEHAHHAGGSNFFGTRAGDSSPYASYSNFYGAYAGREAPYATGSNMFGNGAGWGAAYAAHSNLFGWQVGKGMPGNYIGENNIIIGTNITLPNATVNAINIGGILFGSGTQNDYSAPYPYNTVQVEGKIGIGVLPADQTATLNLTGTTSQAPLRIVSNTTPASPNDGDIWVASNHLYTQLGGSSIQLDGGGGGGITDIAGLIEEGTGVTITGSGTIASPYVISASGGGGGSSQWDDVAEGISYMGGSVGIGATSPSMSALQVTQSSSTQISSWPAFSSGIGYINTPVWSGEGFMFSASDPDDAFSMVYNGISAYFGQLLGASRVEWIHFNGGGIYSGDSNFQIGRDSSDTYFAANFGNVGIGTNTPVAPFQLVSGVSDIRLSSGFGSITPTLTVINTIGKAAALGAGSSGGYFSFDNTGNFYFMSENRANFESDVTGSGNTRLFIKGSDGNIGIGNTNATYLLDVGNSSISGIIASFTNSANTCTINTSLSCSSDERLKTNIEDLDDTILNNLLNIRTISFNWKNDPSSPTQVGFLAQDLQHYFPELVSEGPNDYLQVNYAGMTPILTEAIQEINANITDISDLTTENTWRDALVAWLGNITNGITRIFAHEVKTERICVSDGEGETCLTRSELDALLGNSTSAEGSSTADEPEVPQELQVPAEPEVPEVPDETQTPEVLAEEPPAEELPETEPQPEIPEAPAAPEPAPEPSESDLPTS